MDEEPSKLAEESLEEEDGDFVPSAEMYVHDDIDDERTIDEEEALEQEQQDEGELDDLMKEGEMPLEELLAIYGYNEIHGSEDQNPGDPAKETTEDVQQSSSCDGDKIDADYSEAPEPEGSNHSSPRMLRRSMRLFGNSGGFDKQLVNESESEDDSDYEPEHWKREINIGEGYQADIPEVAPATKEEGNEDRGQCLWKPDIITDKQVRSFLLGIRKERSRKSLSMDSPAATRDDEQALYVLKTNCYDTHKALELIHTSDSFITEAITPWSEQECRQFELGMKKFGKNFTEIKKLIPTRTVKEIVQFYYIWKKTERRDIFIHQIRPNKRKASQMSQITDYMDKFLDDERDSFGGITLDHLSEDLREFDTAAGNQRSPMDSFNDSESDDSSDQVIEQQTLNADHHQAGHDTDTHQSECITDTHQIEQPMFNTGGPQVEQQA